MTTARSLRIGEAVLGGAVLALGLFVAYQTALMKVGPAHAAIGPRLFPFLIATGLIVVGALVLWQGLKGEIAHAGGFELDLPAMATAALGLVVQMLLLERLGWILSATILFVAVARAFGSRRLLVDLALGLVLAGFSFVVFNYGLGLNLPGGTVWELVSAGGTEG